MKAVLAMVGGYVRYRQSLTVLYQWVSLKHDGTDGPVKMAVLRRIAAFRSRDQICCLLSTAMPRPVSLKHDGTDQTDVTAKMARLPVLPDRRDGNTLVLKLGDRS